MKKLYPQIGLARICRLFGVTRQAFYQDQWRSIDTSIENEIILALVVKVRSRHPRMGVRKIYELIHPQLLEHSIKVGRDGLYDLFAQHGLLVRRRKRKAYTTNSFHWLRKYPNLVTNWVLDKPNRVWVCDITYWPKGDGFYYVSLLTDVYSKKILGFKLANTLEAIHTLAALQMAIDELDAPIADLIHHSDRGVQYCSHDYVKLLIENKMTISMGEKGDPLENAVAERINGILKDEYLSAVAPSNFGQAEEQLRRTVALYNTERPHLSCDMLTPCQAHKTEGELKRRWKNSGRHAEA